jgi:hypothetical protein
MAKPNAVRDISGLRAVAPFISLTTRSCRGPRVSPLPSPYDWMVPLSPVVAEHRRSESTRRNSFDDQHKDCARTG